MAPNDDRLSRLFGKKNDPAPDLPPDDPVELEAADGGGRVGAKPLLSVTFIDQDGTPHQFSYSHLYRVAVEGRALAVYFSEHKVVVEGRRLFSPARDCLLRRLGQHRLEFVEATPRGELDGAEVTAVSVVPLKAGG